MDRTAHDELRRAADVDLGRWEFVLQLLIIVSLAAFAVETLPGLDPGVRRVVHAVEVATMVAFTVEYAVRLWRSRPHRRYALSFFGIVDLLSILPFYLALGLGGESLRALRLLRLLQLLKLTRYNVAMLRLYRALVLAREELVMFSVVVLVLLYLAGVGIYRFEHEAQPQAFASVFDGLWWAVCTLTTVGYGDSVPVTAGGRFFTFVVLMIGLGVIAVPVGLVASALGEARRQIADEAVAEAQAQADASARRAHAADVAAGDLGPAARARRQNRRGRRRSRPRGPRTATPDTPRAP